MAHFICLTLLVFAGFHVTYSIHRNLKYYTTIHASELKHHIVKRGLKESNHPFNKIREVNFRTHGRDFRLILTPRKGVLHSNFQAYTVDGDGREHPVAVDHENFYEGRLFGEKSSHASVHLDNDGIMTASIQLPDETYHVEPSWRHLPELGNETMITYKASDVKLSWHGTKTSPCAYVKEGAHLEDDPEDELDDEEYSEAEDGPRARAKRQADQYEYTPTKTRCPLLLVADYRFYQEMGNSNTKITINYLISLIDRVHKIYNDTIWQDRAESEGFKGMGFVIKKIVVHSEPTRVRGGENHYNMVREKWDVRNLLENTSKTGTPSISTPASVPPGTTTVRG
uniref:ADAM 17-like protease n=1 Tax=Lygus hesperus TaxID=30085 RepID=A0A0A9XE39_LYGHE